MFTFLKKSLVKLSTGNLRPQHAITLLTQTQTPNIRTARTAKRPRR